MRSKSSTIATDANGAATDIISVPTTNLRGVKITPASAGVAEVQTITLTGFDGTDSFKLTYNGAESSAFVRGTNAAASDLQTALRTLTSDSGLTVTGTTDAGPYTVTFSATFGNALPLTVTSPSGCTGAVVETVQGVATVVALASLGRTIITCTDVVAATFYPVSELLDKSDGTAATTYAAPGAVIHDAVTVTITSGGVSNNVTVQLFYE